MLLDHYLKNTSTDPEVVAGAEGFRSVFAQTLADAGFPQTSCLRKVALNNGAKNGFTTFSTCTEGVHVRARFTNTTLVVCKAVGLGLCALGPFGCVVGGLLNVGCTVGRNRILDTKVFTTPSNTDRCKIFETSIAGFGLTNYTYYSKGQGNDRMGLDVVPAGTYDVFEAITGAIPTKLTWKILKEDKLNFFVRTLADKSFDATSFIPSVSSYAMLNSNRNWGNSLENVNVPTETPFDAIYAPTNENQEHVTVTEAGVSFLYEQIALSNNCSNSGDCPQSLILTNTITNQTSTQQASESITANNQIINSKVTYKAGQNINLNEGFIADSQTGTVFRAFIQGCISWQSSNIGSGSGSSITSNNTLIINGNGSLGGTSDNVHFYHTPASSDVSIIARINSMNPNNGERAGIMIRTNTNDNSPFYEFIIDGNGNVGKLKRKNTGDNVDFVGFAACPTSGSWIRLDKTGNTIKCYIKTDDSASWAEVVGFDDHNDNNLGGSFEVGFVAYAGASAIFSNITINGNPIN
ncbi:MAG: hypothetical protein U5N85_02955 [Arcicella sp.]|nr:hypothetical protein [Arcicella sp.]